MIIDYDFHNKSCKLNVIQPSDCHFDKPYNKIVYWQCTIMLSEN